MFTRIVFPESQALVSALSAGPIAPGDGVGDTDATLVKRTCRVDGVLLKPDRPALAVDRQWEEYVFESGGLVSGDVTHTRTTLSMGGGGGGDAEEGVFVFVLGIGLDHEWEVSLAADIGDLRPGHYLAWARGYGDPFSPPNKDTLLSLQIPASDNGNDLLGGQPSLHLNSTSASEWGHYTLWRVTPFTCNGQGWALLGEMEKFISVSRQRVKSVTVRCGHVTGMTLALLGSPGERVHMTFYSPTLMKVQTETAVIGGDGSGAVSVGAV